MRTQNDKTHLSKSRFRRGHCPRLPSLGVLAFVALGGTIFGGGMGCAVGTDEAYWRGTVPARYAVDVQTASVQVTDITYESGIRGETELRKGDVILAVDGTDITNLSKAEIDALLYGPVGSYVKLTVLRDGETKEIVVERRPD